MRESRESKIPASEIACEPECLTAPARDEYRRELPPIAVKQFISKKIHSYQHHEQNMAEAEELQNAERAKIKTELYKALDKLVNADAILSASQQRGLHEMIRGIAEEFDQVEQLTFYTGRAEIRMMSLAIYVNTCHP